MQAVAPLDVAAALVATLVIAQSLTLGVIQALRIADGRRAQHSARSDARRHGVPAPAPHTPAGVWLLGLLVLAALQAAGDLIQHLGFVLLTRWLSPVHDAALLLFGPAMLFYARAITQAPSEAPPDWRRFAPHAAPALLLAAVLAFDVLHDPWTVPSETGRRDVAEVLLLLPIAGQILGYLLAVVWRVRAQRARLEAWFSRLQHRQLRWLEVGAWAFAVLVVAWIASWSLPTAVSNVISNGLMAVDVAVLGIFGARQHNVFAASPWQDEAVPRTGGAPLEAAGPDAEPAAAGPAAVPARDTKYAKATIAPAVADAIVERLEQAMQVDRLYLQCDLNLAELAAAVQARPHQLSQVLSTRMGLSFFEYVNRLRVEAVKSTLARPSAVGRPLLEIALECGFGSKSTFNEAFKRATGMSPTDYRRALPASAAEVSATSGMRLR